MIPPLLFLRICIILMDLKSFILIQIRISFNRKDLQETLGVNFGQNAELVQKYITTKGLGQIVGLDEKARQGLREAGWAIIVSQGRLPYQLIKATNRRPHPLPKPQRIRHTARP